MSIQPSVPLATELDGSPASGALLLLVTALLAGVLIAAFLIAASARRRRIVLRESDALSRLWELNSEYAPLVVALPPIRRRYNDSMRSKARLDSFDLNSFLSRCILDDEQWFEAEIKERRVAVDHYVAYQDELQRVINESLGQHRSLHLKLNVFLKIEAKLFRRHQLKYPEAIAEVRGTVNYTSPKGQNSYTRSLEWDFDELRRALAAAQAKRTQQSSAQYQRQRERSLMTDRLRMQVLRRGEFRCRMCGASSQHGIQLHVDHVLPVSRGGLTTLENLQVLCQACNLGKGNSFVG